MDPKVIDTVDVIDMMGGRFEVAAEFGTGDDSTVLLRTRQPPGRLVPLHDHSPECIYVLSGALEVWIEQPEPGWRTVKPGQSLYLDNLIKHALRNTGDIPCDFLLLIHGRLARFFREAGSPADLAHPPKAPTSEMIQHTTEVAKRFDFWIASPAEAMEMMGPSGVPAPLLTQPKP